LAGAHDVAMGLPKEYDQMLGNSFEDGIDLSIGQWQKVALARVFYKDAEILILDEPTASIDARSESEIFKRVERLSDNKTVLIISHRFSTVRNADKIYVLDKGKIKEEGSHAQLMKLNGIYSELFNLQAKAYK
jgi:ATP-binding cassette subfamily B protein